MSPSSVVYSQTKSDGNHDPDSTVTLTCPDDHVVYFEFADGVTLRTTEFSETAQCKPSKWYFDGREIAVASCAGEIHPSIIFQ